MARAWVRAGITAIAWMVLGAATMLCASAAVVVPGSADAGRVQERAATPESETPKPAPTIEEGKPVLPPVSVGKGFVLKAVVINGATVFPPAELQAIVAPYIGQRVDVGSLNFIAGRITEHYSASGYLLSEAMVPAQTVKHGVVHIAVIEGYIARVRVEGEPSGDHLGIVEATKQKILASRPLYGPTLDHFVQLLNDLGGVEVAAIMERIDDKNAPVGGVGLVLKFTPTTQPRSSLLLNNFGSRYSGPWEATGSTQFYSVASAFDTLAVMPETVTFSGYTINGADAGNYTLSQPASSTANITPYGLTVSGMTASNKVYDATTAATINNSSDSLVGVFGGDTVSLNTATTASFSDKNVGTGKTVTASGFTISGADSGNYTLSQPTATANITAKSLTISGVSASDKTYDRTVTDTLVTAGDSLLGVIGGDTVTLNSGGASGVFVDANAGVGKSVTATGFTISGADAGNYSLSQPTGLTATINAKGLTVSATNSSKTYGGSDPGFAYTYLGLVSGDGSASFTGALSRVAGETVGNYAINQGSLLATGNYTILTFNSGTFTINDVASPPPPPPAPSISAAAISQILQQVPILVSIQTSVPGINVSPVAVPSQVSGQGTTADTNGTATAAAGLSPGVGTAMPGKGVLHRAWCDNMQDGSPACEAK